VLKKLFAEKAFYLPENYPKKVRQVFMVGEFNPPSPPPGNLKLKSIGF